jgi:hypothetical protein
MLHLMQLCELATNAAGTATKSAVTRRQKDVNGLAGGDTAGREQAGTRAAPKATPKNEEHVRPRHQHRDRGGKDERDEETLVDRHRPHAATKADLVIARPLCSTPCLVTSRRPESHLAPRTEAATPSIERATS